MPILDLDGATLRWEQLPVCQHAECAPWMATGIEVCGQPAAYRATWNGTDWIYLCAAHAADVEEAG